MRYKNPREREGGAREGEYESGLLVPVGERWVLGGYTRTAGRELGEKELRLFERVREGLRSYLVV